MLTDLADVKARVERIWRMATMRPLVTIEESTILGMLKNPQFLTAFPFLQQLKTNIEGLGDCGSCRRNPATRQKLQRRKDLLSNARHTFAHLPIAQKVVLKGLLQTRKIRVTYMSGTKRIQLTY
jgi:hypothetical protein